MWTLLDTILAITLGALYASRVFSKRLAYYCCFAYFFFFLGLKIYDEIMVFNLYPNILLWTKHFLLHVLVYPIAILPLFNPHVKLEKLLNIKVFTIIFLLIGTYEIISWSFSIPRFQIQKLSLATWAFACTLQLTFFRKRKIPNIVNLALTHFCLSLASELYELTFILSQHGLQFLINPKIIISTAMLTFLLYKHNWQPRPLMLIPIPFIIATWIFWPHFQTYPLAAATRLPTIMFFLTIPFGMKR
jgi:hypothetical protein